nr:hypothetical protein [Tanacetum cinerariifolium]
MFMTMEPEIQRNLEPLHAHEMLKELKTLFAQQIEYELLQTTRDFHSCRQEEGQSVSSYVLKIKGYIDNLECLGHPVTLGLGVILILINLRKEYDGFVQNYNMHVMGKTVNELHAMLKLHEQTLPKSNAPALIAIRAGKVQKGHWKRNCPQYLAELIKKKKNTASGAGGLGIFVIELNTILNRSWIYDTGCGTHICNTTQGLRASRKLKPGALSLGVIYVSRLYEDGFVNRFVDNTIQVSRNNVVYFSVVLRDGIFEIDLSNSLANVSSIYVVRNKRAKLDLDSALLWHCRLGHISKKRIEKLQHDGHLDSSDLKAFEKCVSCMSGKMARKPYTHQVERAKDLLRLIHTDVCGPFKFMSRQGASYFITFTDDFSRYGYVYLLKHKHEVFETFKVFQKEVENQLGKTIKSLCSDRGGEYMSKEFLDHLKDHGIIAHSTPPYTSQHNGVSERRNKTLLDMVRSMISQTTLPKSFWDYALETATRILNMVPTKKVEKTPYEVWHGKAPKLSYLKVWGCEALVKRDTLTKHNKLEPRSIKCIFIGYPKETMRYSFYYPPENKVLVARNAEFLENNNEVWVLVELPPNGKTVGSKWLFKKKTDMEGNAHIYKACLVAKGYTQTPGIDYEETFSPVTDIRAIRILIAILAYYDYEIWQMDFKTAFLDRYLNKEVYMEQPQGFVNLKYPNRYSNATKCKTYLGKCFAMKDLGEAAYILRIKIYRDRSKRLIGLCQSTYIEKILKRFCMENFKRGSIPMQEKLKLSKSQGASTPAEMKRMQNVPYASAVSSIMNTKDMFLVYGGDLKRKLRVSCYTDVGYLTDADDLKSQTGYVFILNGGAVDWKSVKQSIFATSSVEAEYIAAFDASKEAVWVRKFIFRLGVVPTIKEPISMYCDNTGAIVIANEFGITKGARHFRAKVHYLREVIEFGDIKLEKVHTDDNIADPFTKALTFPKHSVHTRNIGMLPASSLM